MYVPTKLEQSRDSLREGDKLYLPCQVEVRLAIQVELIFQHLSHGFRGSSLLGNFEFGDLLLCGVSRTIGSALGDSAFTENMSLVSFDGIFVESFDDLIRIDLPDVSLWIW